MLAPYQKYSCTNSNKWFASHPCGIHNEYQEMRSSQHVKISNFMFMLFALVSIVYMFMGVILFQIFLFIFIGLS